MLQYAPQLVLPAVCIIGATLLFSIIVSVFQTGIKNKEMQSSAKESGLVFSLLSGIQKIKLSGSEKRMFSRMASSKLLPPSEVVQSTQRALSG